MSLTSFLNLAEVREKFKQEFNKPTFKIKKTILAPPKTTNYNHVGTAFDYLFRFYIERLNPNVKTQPWVAEETINCNLVNDKKLLSKIKDIIKVAKENYQTYLKTGIFTKEILHSALLLAHVDIIYRTKGEAISANFGSIEEKDAEDLRNLIELINPKNFKANKICLLNPTFGFASKLVGGADADLIIDDTLIDIKTTKKLEFKRDYLNQLVGYYILNKIDKADECKNKIEIKKLGVYYSRYGLLFTFPVKEVLNDTFNNFVKWFEKTAQDTFIFTKK